MKSATAESETAGGKEEEDAVVDSLVYGCTCDWDDVILPHISLPRLSIGDILLFDNAGAYSHACSSAFNGMLFSNRNMYVYRADDGHHKDGFHVAYSIQPVPGKGLGLVVNQPVVRRGDIIWAFEAEGVTHNIVDEQTARRKLQRLTEVERQFFLNHIFCWRGRMYELLGDCKFMNHSAQPSLITDDDGLSWVAARDLHQGQSHVYCVCCCTSCYIYMYMHMFFFC
jgi:hypothetical protein